MFYRNNTALITLFVFTVISFQTLSHAQLNVVTIGDASNLGDNSFEITPNQVYLSVVNPIFSTKITTIFTERITDICGENILLNLTTVSNNGFRDT